ncbi:NDR1/HIN1-like protein 2 [Cocos nucifera]|nr:NDR1/HIN1-like protein 2 [Cocos nucifera]
MTSRTTQANGDHHRRRPYPSPGGRAHYLGPSSYSSSSSSAASLKGCCCCLFLLLTFLALLAIAVILVIVLAVKPKKPQFDLQQVAVQYLLVAPSVAAGTTASAPTAAYLSLNISLLFIAENPNKVGIRYGETQFVVMYRGVPLGVATVPAFEQPAHSTRLVQTWVSVSRFNVLQADALDLIRDTTVNDRVELHVTGDVGAKIRVLGFTSPRVQVSVHCAIVISPRKQSLTSKQCEVDGLNV